MADEQKPKQVVEWSFSFDEVGKSVNRALGKLSGDQEVKTDRFSLPLEGTRSARISLGLSIGTANVRALNGSENLIQADVKYTGEMEFTSSGEAEKTVRLGQKRASSPIKNALGAISHREDLHWEIGLSPDVPIDLDIDGGVGSSTLDLTGLRITAFHMDGGVGENRLTLPNTGAAYNADLSGGVGETRIKLLDGALVRLRVKGGVGGTIIELPEGMAVRVEVKGGLGGASFAPRFARTKGGDDFISMSGTWETAGYSLAQQQVFIQFDGGVGGLKVV